jgi:hypothetical protein
MWNLGSSSEIAVGPRKTTENLDGVGRSQYLPDANLTSSQQSGIEYAHPNISLTVDLEKKKSFHNCFLDMCILWKSARQLFITSVKRMLANTHILSRNIHIFTFVII